MMLARQGRATPDAGAHLRRGLAAPFQAIRLHTEVAPDHPAGQQFDQAGHGTTLLYAQGDGHTACRTLPDLMAGLGLKAAAPIADPRATAM